MTTTTIPAHELAAARLGRNLTRGETRIDLVRLDRALASAKERLVAEIERQRRKGYRAVLAGRPFRLERTPEMDAILVELYETGVDAARAEIRAAGYDPDLLPATFAAVELPTTLEPVGRALDARLSALGRDTQARILATDLSGLSTSAILGAFQAIPGARAVASDFVSTPLLNGMGDVWGQADAAGIVETWTYSAVLDAGTCPVCESLDGDTFESWEAIQDVLPNGGPNPDCDGGDRCRCRAVPELADPTTPSGFPVAPGPVGGTTFPVGEADLGPLVGRPAIDDAFPQPPAPAPTVTELVPGPPMEIRARVQNEMIHQITKTAETRGIEPQLLHDQIQEAIERNTRDAIVQIRIRPGPLARVLDDGRFKSQFETGTSQGALNPALRSKAEGQMFGYPEDLDPASRPIYGYLSGAYEPSVQGYGEIVVRLKPSVRARTTLTLDDSLGGGGIEFLPSPLDSPRAISFRWSGYQKVPDDPSTATLRELYSSYPEAQIHGGLAVDDVAELAVPPWSPSAIWTIDHDRAIADAAEAERAAAETTSPTDRIRLLATIRKRLADAEAIEREFLTDPYAEIIERAERLGIPVVREDAERVGRAELDAAVARIRAETGG